MTLEEITEENRVDVLAFSGGKDSVATFLHMREHGVRFLTVFADTGHEHPSTYEYLDYFENKFDFKILRVKADFTERMAKKREYIRKRWHKPFTSSRWGKTAVRRALTDAEIARALEVIQPTGIPMLDLILLKGMMPTPRQKFCSMELKQIPVMEQVYEPLMRAGLMPICWQGVRAQESPARSRYSPIDETPDGLLMYRPILLWKHEDVFRIARKHGVEHNPLYAQGMSRVGCMPCINSSYRELGEIARRFPEEVERVAEWERLSAKAARHPKTQEDGVMDFLPFKNTTGGDLKGIKVVLEHAQTKKGFIQWKDDEFFQDDADPDVCSAVYPVVCE